MQFDSMGAGTTVVPLVLLVLLFAVLVVLLLVIRSIKRHRDPHLRIYCNAPTDELIPSLTGLTRGTSIEVNAAGSAISPISKPFFGRTARSASALRMRSRSGAGVPRSIHARVLGCCARGATRGQLRARFRGPYRAEAGGVAQNAACGSGSRTTRCTRSTNSSELCRPSNARGVCRWRSTIRGRSRK